MSLEQQPQKHDNTPVESLPPYPHSKADTVTPPVEHRDEKKGMSLKTKIGLVLAGLGIAGTAGVVGNSMGGSEAAPTPDRSPAASATPNPGQSETSAPEQAPEATTEFGFSAEDYKDNPEQLMIDFVNQENVWKNSGFTEGVEDNDLRRFELADDMAYAMEITSASNNAFADSVFVDGWQGIQNVNEFYDNQVYIHADNVATALKTTQDVNRENLEPYKRYTDVVPGSVTAEVQPDGSIVGSFDYTGRDNADMNKAEDVYGGGGNPNDETGDYSLTFVNVDGTLRLADIQVHSD